MINYIKKIGLVCMGVCTMLVAIAQEKPAIPSVAAPEKPVVEAPKAGPKAYKDVITSKTVTSKGFFTVHRVEDKYYMEISPKLFGRDILMVNRVSKSSAESPKAFNGYAGDQIGESVIRFEMGPKNKVFLKNISYDVNPDSARPMYKSVMNSNLQPITLAFDIKAIASDSMGKGVVIDITDVITTDNEVFGFSGSSKSQFSAGAFQADKSYIESVRPYPTNIEITTVKTFTKSAGIPSLIPGSAPKAPSMATVTLEMNSSMLLLPEKPMKPRYQDDRVGYFGPRYTDYDANPQGGQNIQLISRWRLEPKPEDMAKYKRGELVEPLKPIIFYIDPTTPKQWVPYLIQGVNDWQVAFEQAGFKNAIMAKEAPTKEQDSTWSMEDARNSGIIYKPSAVENAYGPSTVDPRSGEIMESHIGWFHNVMKLLHAWSATQLWFICRCAGRKIAQ